MSAKVDVTVWVTREQKERLFALQCSHLLHSASETVQHLLDEHERNNGNCDALEEAVPVDH